MSSVVPDKVDMSLDDIIKISRLEKRKQVRLAKRQNTGGGAQTGGGTQRGRGQGRGVRQTVNPIKQLHLNVQGGKRGRGRGRGRGINRQNSGISPLNRTNIEQQNFQVRGRGSARRGHVVRVFTNSGFRAQTGQQQQQAVQRRDRISKVKQQATLLREKQLAIKNLQQAKKNMQTINMAIQKSSRESTVNQLRGVNNIQTGQSRGRGRRKLLASLNRPGSDSSLSNTSAERQLSNTSVTITNPSALSTSPAPGRGKRRWRRNAGKHIASEHFTVHVAGQNLETVKKQSSVLNQLKLLKPSVTTTYKFHQSVFATPATGISLNDRFSGGSCGDGGDGSLEDRKVFI